jgi:hypothetical protein
MASNFCVRITCLYLTVKFHINYCSEKEQDLFNAMGSMYAAVFLIGMKNSNSVQPVVSVERTVFYRERAAGMYSAFPYAFAQASICLILKKLSYV